jgi:hypothetical protein
MPGILGKSVVYRHLVERRPTHGYARHPKSVNKPRNNKRKFRLWCVGKSSFWSLLSDSEPCLPHWLPAPVLILLRVNEIPPTSATSCYRKGRVFAFLITPCVSKKTRGGV